ncbi:MAG: signal recognition particle-docking protein FtsY [Planctomycetes bacterium]|nr:signal recognition particle-docking protein FtsY [Planctomycetota bacterium]
MFKGVLEKLKQGLAKTRNAFRRVRDLFSGNRAIDAKLLEELEEVLITSDLGLSSTTMLIARLREAYQAGRVKDTSQLYDYLKVELKQMLTQGGNVVRMAAEPPTVVLVVGVNGSGKTTSIAKLASWFTKQGKTVLLAAGDTFRAAAIEQLAIWSQRVGVELIRHQTGADPAAVVFDAAQAAAARKVDLLLVDTAGRLHTKANLMKELEKMHAVLGRKIPGAPHEVLLVLDATTGQNAINQAKIFHEATRVDGIFLSKLDGTAKGGIVVAVKNEIGIPVKFVGLGETPEDVEAFDADKFVDALFAE